MFRKCCATIEFVNDRTVNDNSFVSNMHGEPATSQRKPFGKYLALNLPAVRNDQVKPSLKYKFFFYSNSQLHYSYHTTF